MTTADEMDLARRKLKSQVDLIVKAFPEARIEPENWEELGVDYIYRAAHLLMRDEDVERVNRMIPGVLVPRRSDRDQDGRQRAELLNSVTIGPRTRPTGLSLFAATSDESVPALCERIDAELGPGIATPDHLLYLVGQGSHCPATEPEPEPDDALPVPAPASGSGGTDVLVNILDSGWFPGSDTRHAWLAGVSGETEDTYFPAVDAHGNPEPKVGQIMPYSGHGTFCAGVLRSVAPGAEVYVNKTFFGAGGAFESDITAQVQRGLSLGAGIFSLSAGCYSRDDIPLLGFDVILDLISQYKGVVLVAAAGNDTTKRPFWPAASPGVVSVGALDAAGTARAGYSNYGGWVDVYAPGTDLVNAFVDGTFTYTEPPHDDPNNPRSEKFDGMARWSGTSFATPYVAGLIAAQMYRTGQNGQDAAAELLAQAQANAVPGVGAILT